MKLYCGIDLHSNNHYVTIIDEDDRRIIDKRLNNDLTKTLSLLTHYRADLCGIAIESTFNWYWLVDGLMDAGYPVFLVNTCAVQQYDGLKYTDDKHDAFWLAHLMRLGILPTGYIYPKEQRGLRDLLRKRMQLVQYRTGQILSIQNQFWRSLGQRLKSQDIKQGIELPITALTDPNIRMAIQSNINVVQMLNTQIDTLEQAVQRQCKNIPEYQQLQTVFGIGKILAQTITLETGNIRRFNNAGQFASYSRCVGSKKTSNGKNKGKGNTKSGNKYLAWAFMEAANAAINHYSQAKRFYQRKMAKRNVILARKALAHKLARASYYVMRDGVPFMPERLFL
ncbi:MAG: IS110 family transposase [Gammaproteobacteria bacterium]|nr:IS110 family transposase [Gammaproteobacteria bacterium]